MSTLIQAKNIGLHYGSYEAIYDFNISIKQGEIITIIGPVGCGKTSAMKILSGILKSSHGVIEKKDNLVIGYMPQEARFNTNMPISVLSFLELTGKKMHSIQNICQDLHIKDLLHKQIHTLSPGELKLVLLANALKTKPELLLLDEPTSSMDVNMQNHFYQLLNKIRSEYNCGIVITSHDLHLVMRQSDYVICMNRHICCKGKPIDISRDSEFIKLFGNSLSIYTHHHDHLHNIHQNIESK